MFQRWETRHHDGEDRVFEVVYKLKLILEPETSDRSSSHSSIEPVDNTYTAKSKDKVFKRIHFSRLFSSLNSIRRTSILNQPTGSNMHDRSWFIVFSFFFFAF